MRDRVPSLIVLSVSVLLLCGAGAAPSRLQESWLALDRGPAQFRKVSVVGISADRQIRHRFEDLFITRLRVQDFEAVTSYSLVPDLVKVENRQVLIDQILEQRIQGVISVRVVDLKGTDDDAWSSAWNDGLEAGTTLRQVIDATLEQDNSKASKLGLEVALWDAQTWKCLWAGRSGPHKRKSLRKNTGAYVRLIMSELDRANMLPRPRP